MKRQGKRDKGTYFKFIFKPRNLIVIGREHECRGFLSGFSDFLPSAKIIRAWSVMHATYGGSLRRLCTVVR